MDIKIYSLHLPHIHRFLENDIFVRLSQDIFKAEIREEWGELAAIYWAWKHSKADYIGYMQAQRYLACVEMENRDRTFSEMSSNVISENGWDTRNLTNLLKKYTYILPQSYSFEFVSVDLDVTTPIDFYKSEGGEQEQIDFLLFLIKKNYPHYYDAALEFLEGETIRPWNLFIFPRDIFEDYAGFLFDLLSKFQGEHVLKSEKSFHRPLYMLMGEFIYNIYVHHLLKSSRKCPVLECPIIFIEQKNYDIESKKILKNIIQHENIILKASPKDVLFGGKIHIVLSFDNKYAPHALSVIYSILSHTANKEDLVFHILYDEHLSVDYIKLLESNNAFKTRFYKIEKSFIHELPLTIKHISVSTYYRLLIQNLIPEDITRIIYLDTDLIVCDDIVELWNIDLQDYSIGAVRDEIELIAARRIFSDKKDLSNYRTFNAGVMIFDLKKIKEKYGDIAQYYKNIFHENEKYITMQDQDILNLTYKEDVFYLPLRWNMLSCIFYSFNTHSDCCYTGHQNNYDLEEYERVRRNPAILHFVGKRKAWRFFTPHPLKSLYWRYRVKSQNNRRLSLKQYFCAYNNFLVVKGGWLSVMIGGREYSYNLRRRYKKLLKKE